MQNTAPDRLAGRTIKGFFSGILTVAAILVFAVTPLYSQDIELKAADLVVDGQLIDIEGQAYQQLFDELVQEHDFNRDVLITLFAGLRINRKVLELMDKQWEAKPYYEYRPLFITPSVIDQGRASLDKYRQLFDRVEDRYGVDREYIVAIWAIESRFGANQGSFELFASLNTLFAAYPRRSDFFRKELIHFLLLCRNNNLEPKSIKGSYAGAFGQAQFMPSSFNAFGVDFDEDGLVDLISSEADIFGSIAHYLSSHGWRLDAPVVVELGDNLNAPELSDILSLGRQGRIEWRQLALLQGLDLPRPPHNEELALIGLQVNPHSSRNMQYFAGYPNFLAITEYNHSNKYAMAVCEMAAAFVQ